jgi:hypothetical protein
MTIYTHNTITETFMEGILMKCRDMKRVERVESSAFTISITFHSWRKGRCTSEKYM